jgi:nicotinamidase-related amidase
MIEATTSTIEAKPFPFAFSPSSVALLMIDWQGDFLDERGFGASLGNDVSSLRRGVDNAKRLLELFRSKNLTIAHTLEAHARDLSDVHPAKKRRCPKIGEKGKLGRVLIKGEAGNAIIDELQPRDSEIIIHKPGKGAFYATDLEMQLRSAGCTHLIMTGVTTEVCVQSTAREANDRGFEVLVVSDATESYIPAFKQATLEMIVSQGGIVGWTAETGQVVKALA